MKLQEALRMIHEGNLVEVVRCKDCKYNTSDSKCINPKSFFLIPSDDDFCSFGERKEIEM